jgi:aldose 1-epimerase
VENCGVLPDGRAARLFSLVNARGARADISNYGAILVRLLVPDRAGRFEDIVLGCRTAGDYAANRHYHGAVAGRYAGRIAGGRFSLDGKAHQLTLNSTAAGTPCHLHGGTRGFDRALWNVDRFEPGPEPTLAFSLLSPDGDEGYPGTLRAGITYALLADNSLRIEHHLTTDRPTPVNLTQHNYFNLRGEGRGDILGHILAIEAPHYLPLHPTMIPTGEIAAVTGTPFDFTAPAAMGARIDQPSAQLILAGGYDHDWVLDNPGGRLVRAATVHEPGSGRRMEVWAQEPALHLYTGNFLDGTTAGKNGKPHRCREGFCLETQHFPDSPNQPHFPSTILRPDETYRTTTHFKFGVA